MQFTETATQIIDLASAAQNYWETELPKRHPNYPIVDLFEDSGPPPPEEAALKELLERLPDEQVYKLLLVMYLGRGDFQADELAKQHDYLEERFRKREWAISQMRGKAPLADYLTDGLAELKKNGIDLDQMHFASVVAGH